MAESSNRRAIGPDNPHNFEKFTQQFVAQKLAILSSLDFLEKYFVGRSFLEGRSRCFKDGIEDDSIRIKRFGHVVRWFCEGATHLGFDTDTWPLRQLVADGIDPATGINRKKFESARKATIALLMEYEGAIETARSEKNPTTDAGKNTAKARTISAGTDSGTKADPFAEQFRFNDPDTGKSHSIPRPLLWELFKTLWNSAGRRLTFEQLMDGRIPRWENANITESAIRQAAKELGRFLKKNGLSSKAKKITIKAKTVGYDCE